MSDYGRLETDPLFVALTRPSMLLGVTYGWFALNAFIWLVYFIQTSSFLMILVGGGAIHLVGYLACSIEPRFVEITMVWAKTFSKCQNKRFHSNTTSYDLF